MNQSDPNSSSHGKVALIRAAWHADIVEQCCNSFIDELTRLSDGSLTVETFEVPGAFEIPLQARSLLRSQRYLAAVGAAFVVDGGIYRHEFVAQAVINGLMQVQLDTDLPVLSAVLTPHHFHESSEHQAFFTQHFKTKGVEVANACWSVLGLRSVARAA